MLRKFLSRFPRGTANHQIKEKSLKNIKTMTEQIILYAFLVSNKLVDVVHATWKN